MGRMQVAADIVVLSFPGLGSPRVVNGYGSVALPFCAPRKLVSRESFY
jgi:hypothetical protein